MLVLSEPELTDTLRTRALNRIGPCAAFPQVIPEGAGPVKRVADLLLVLGPGVRTRASEATGSRLGRSPTA